jgi:hypothetical protein
MSEFKWYGKKPGLLRPYVVGEDMTGISVGPEDVKAGSPKEGDWIGQNPNNPKDQWLVASEYFNKNFDPSPLPDPVPATS